MVSVHLHCSVVFGIYDIAIASCVAEFRYETLRLAALVAQEVDVSIVGMAVGEVYPFWQRCVAADAYRREIALAPHFFDYGNAEARY